MKIVARILVVALMLTSLAPMAEAQVATGEGRPDPTGRGRYLQYGAEVKHPGATVLKELPADAKCAPAGELVGVSLWNTTRTDHAIVSRLTDKAEVAMVGTRTFLCWCADGFNELFVPKPNIAPTPPTPTVAPQAPTAQVFRDPNGNVTVNVTNTITQTVQQEAKTNVPTQAPMPVAPVFAKKGGMPTWAKWAIGLGAAAAGGYLIYKATKKDKPAPPPPNNNPPPPGGGTLPPATPAPAPPSGGTAPPSSTPPPSGGSGSNGGGSSPAPLPPASENKPVCTNPKACS